MEEHQAAPATGAETPEVTVPSAATMTQATAQATAQAGGKKPTTAAVMAQATALQQAETIKQLQRQMKSLEAQTKDTGKVFLATMTSLITSAFALVAALAWNAAIQDLFKLIFKPQDQAQQVNQGQVIGEFGYALAVTVIVVLVIFYLTQLNTRLGGKSLIGEAGREEEGSKKGKEG
jgi:hypothetical protein